MPLQQTSGNDTADAYGGGSAAKVKYIEDFFVTWLRTGTGASATVTTGLDASVNKALVWTKSRSAATDHKLTDTVRGATKALISDTTGAQTTDSTGLTAFSSTGYTIGADANYNNSGATYVDWEFVATPKFFDVVTYTGDGAALKTISHNLGSTPGCMIIKSTSSSSWNWVVYHQSLGVTQKLYLNTTGAAIAENGNFGGTAPTSTNFSVGYNATNESGGTYVAYLLAHNAGGFGLTGTDNVISCGSFTAGASGFGPVTLGYEPQYILFKRTDSVQAWYVWDTMRGMALTSSVSLSPNSSAAELNWGASSYVYPTATGFAGSGDFFGNGANVIYIAIRRGPMKVPTDGTKVFQAALRTGTGATATVTGINFPPDLSILGNRTIVNTRNFWDRLRGAGYYVGPNTFGAELSNATTVTSFNMNGISLGADTSNTANYNGSDFVNYYFQRAPSFFDEVCYTGTGAVQALNHNLGAVPELIICKARSSAQNWFVYSAAVGNTKTLYLNLTNAASTANAVYWNNTSPTSTQFTLGTAGGLNGSGNTNVAYLFATCPGVSKVGSYTGNGTTQAIACGFTGGARFVLIKRTNSTGDWYVYDTARGMSTLTDPYLLLNSTAAETATLGSVTTTTGGFTVNAAVLAAINTNAASYIFLAIA